MGLKKEHILYFLHQLAKMDLKDIDCQRRLIKTFVNAVFVYDDKVVLTFHYSSDDRTITLNEIDGELQHGVCISPSAAHQKSRYPKGYLLFCCSRRDSKNQIQHAGGVLGDG